MTFVRECGLSGIDPQGRCMEGQYLVLPGVANPIKWDTDRTLISIWILIWYPQPHEHNLTLDILNFFHSWLAKTDESIYMFVVVNFNALAQTSGFRIERRRLPLLNAGFKPRVSGTESPADWMPADKLTELPRIKLKYLKLNSLSLWSVSIQPTWPPLPVGFRTWLWQYTCLL